jgi:hypothetical protein
LPFEFIHDKAFKFSSIAKPSAGLFFSVFSFIAEQLIVDANYLQVEKQGSY